MADHEWQHLNHAHVLLVLIHPAAAQRASAVCLLSGNGRSSDCSTLLCASSAQCLPLSNCSVALIKLKKIKKTTRDKIYSSGNYEKPSVYCRAEQFQVRPQRKNQTKPFLDELCRTSLLKSSRSEERALLL